MTWGGGLVLRVAGLDATMKGHGGVASGTFGTMPRGKIGERIASAPTMLAATASDRSHHSLRGRAMLYHIMGRGYIRKATPSGGFMSLRVCEPAGGVASTPTTISLAPGLRFDCEDASKNS